MVKLAFIPGRGADCGRRWQVVSCCGTAARHGAGQNLACLRFHGLPVAGRLHPEFLFHWFFQIANGQGRAHGVILVSESNAVKARKKL